MTASATEAAFQLCPDMKLLFSCALTYIQNISHFYSWVAGAKFLAQGNNSSIYFPLLQLGGWGKVSCPRKQQ